MTEVRASLTRVAAETSVPGSGLPAVSLLLGVADTANKNQKLHPWRQVFRDLFLADL